MAGGPQTLDGGVEADHGLCHGVAGRVGVKAAVDERSGLEQRTEPSGIGAGAGSGEATVVRMQERATNGVNG